MTEHNPTRPKTQKRPRVHQTNNNDRVQEAYDKTPEVYIILFAGFLVPFKDSLCKLRNEVALHGKAKRKKIIKEAKNQIVVKDYMYQVPCLFC